MSIFDSIGEVFGAGGGGGKGAPPAYQSIGLDEGTKSLLDNQKQRAARSNQDFANDLTRGTEGAKGVMQSDSQAARQNAALGMHDDQAMRDAISARSKKYFDTNQANIQSNANAAAPLQKYDATSMVAKDFMAQQQNFNHNVQMQNQAKMQKVMARNSAISSIFGGIGSVWGMTTAPKPGESASDGRHIGESENQNFAGGYAGSDAANASIVS